MKNIILIFFGLGMGKIAFAQTYLPLTAGSANPLSSTLYINSNSNLISGSSVTGTNRAVGGFSNASGNIFWGINGNSVNDLFGGSEIYSAVIGTSTTNPFHIATNNIVRQTINSNGNIGIGTTSPVTSSLSGALTVVKSYLSDGASIPTTNAQNYYDNQSSLFLFGRNTGVTMIGNNDEDALVYFANASNTGLGSIRYRLNNSGNDFMAFSTGGTNTERMRIAGSGNIGIGTTTPAEKLSVNGNVRAKEIKVESSGWPDYVFEPQYKLLSLKETEQFIKDKRHLPEIPSAKEVEKDGINLGEMNAKLLQKIEELTLHLIRLEKEVDYLKTSVKK